MSIVIANHPIVDPPPAVELESIEKVLQEALFQVNKERLEQSKKEIFTDSTDAPMGGAGGGEKL